MDRHGMSFAKRAAIFAGALFLSYIGSYALLRQTGYLNAFYIYHGPTDADRELLVGGRANSDVLNNFFWTVYGPLIVAEFETRYPVKQEE